MNAVVDVQRQVNAGPEGEVLRGWVEAVLAAEGRQDELELTVRIVDANEIAVLNQRYRNKPGPTNVLSFPFEAPSGVSLNLLGDLVIAAPVVTEEARRQGKTETAHWAHLVVHGTLHLLGYDHQTAAQAEAMERREIRILHSLGYPNPYLLDEAS
ncbi:MAG: rRNA maturation RNase YbeY [Proteobacteria bacterium]|jgi:probable rRNA maturation factor|nr:rRNA maturation RNase YbeY [Pseudomonadota bacterium]